MSIAARLLNEAATRAAAEGVRKLKIDPWTAERLAPVAVSLVLYGLKRSTAGVARAAALAFLLSRYREDLLQREHRLADPDVKARGQTLLSGILGGDGDRAVTALAELAGIDPQQAARLLEITVPAVMSAFAVAKRQLRLNALQIQGVIASEAAAIDRADAQLVRDLREWVFRPGLVRQAMKRIGALLPMRRAKLAQAE